MGRIRRGWELTKKSWGLLRENPQLFRFPLYGVAATIPLALITFLAVPVIAFEGPGAFGTLKRSSTLFRERWGQQITGNIAIGGAVALLGMIPAIILVVAGVAIWSSAGFIGALLVICGIIVFLIAMLISSALGGIFGVALYHYALEGQSVGGFTSGELESAVKLKRGAAQPAGI